MHEAWQMVRIGRSEDVARPRKGGKPEAQKKPEAGGAESQSRGGPRRGDTDGQEGASLLAPAEFGDMGG